MPTFTTNFNLSKPLVNNPTDADLWGNELNSDMDTIDSVMKVARDWLVAAKTTTYAVTVADRRTLFTCDATAAGFTLTLPTIASVGVGYEVAFKKTDATANIVTVAGNGAELIDLANTNTLTAQSQTLVLVAGAVSWYVLDKTFINTPVFTGAFESTEQSIVGTGSIAVSHGLGVQPKNFSLTIRCKSAELGYAVGDEVIEPIYIQTAGFNISVWASSTQLGLACSNNPVIMHKTTQTLSNITNASWKWVFRAQV